MAQKIIKIGSSIGVVFPKPMVDELGLKHGEEVIADAMDVNNIVIRRRARRGTNQENLVKWAATYVERYRKDFEALAEK